MTVEDTHTITTEAAPAAVIAEPSNEAVSEDAAMDAVWGKFHPDDRVERENGKFVSADPEKRAAAEAAKTETPLEGGEGVGAADASTVSDVPLPANWRGLEDTWSKVPAELRETIAAHEGKLHKTLSEQGSVLGQLKPLGDAANEFADYFNRNLKTGDGEPVTPASAVKYLFGIQRAMDKDPSATIVSIMDTYRVRDKVAALLGVKAEAAPPQQNQDLLNTVSRLEATIRELTNPQRIEEVVDKKTAKAKHDEEVSRLEKSKPLYSKIDPADMVHFIKKAWTALGPDAAKEAVFDHAYNAAVEADPALRAQSTAAGEAAKDAAKKAEAAKRGTSVNVTSTAQTKPRVQSEDDAMEEVWRKHH